jgi:hypothetical protein
MMRFDLHVHSKYSSDGVLDPSEIVRIGLVKGLSGIAVTDHNTIQGGLETSRYATADFTVIVGAEIMTDKGEVTGLFLSDEIKPSTFHEVAAEIRRQGGIIIIPHPFDSLRHSAFAITDEYAPSVDGIEVFNSRCVLNRYNTRARDFASKHNLALIGGSDAHYRREIGMGGVQTETRDVRKAILTRQLEPYGRRSSILNHVRSKLRKWSNQTNE